MSDPATSNGGETYCDTCGRAICESRLAAHLASKKHKTLFAKRAAVAQLEAEKQELAAKKGGGATPKLPEKKSKAAPKPPGGASIIAPSATAPPAAKPLTTPPAAPPPANAPPAVEPSATAPPAAAPPATAPPATEPDDGDEPSATEPDDGDGPPAAEPDENEEPSSAPAEKANSHAAVTDSKKSKPPAKARAAPAKKDKPPAGDKSRIELPADPSNPGSVWCAICKQSVARPRSQAHLLAGKHAAAVAKFVLAALTAPPAKPAADILGLADL